MLAYVEVPFGTWSREIGPQTNIELPVGNDIMVLTNAALVDTRERGRSSLKLSSMKKEGSQSSTLCSLIPHAIESVPLSVRLGRQETYIIENLGLNGVDITGHYVGYISVPGATGEGGNRANIGHSIAQTRPDISQKKKRKRVTEGKVEQLAFKTASGNRVPVADIKGTQPKRTAARNATASTSRKRLEDDDNEAVVLDYDVEAVRKKKKFVHK